MFAVTVVEGELLWREHPDPRPGVGELAVEVRAAGLNAADLLQRRGLYPAPAGVAPDVLGLELAGTVVEVGAGVERFVVGDRVMAVVGGGGQAERAVIHERTALAVPPALSWAEAGGFPEAFTTAHDALFTQCELSLGERVLVHGAAGGVGTAAVQLALAAGARVVATVRDPARRSGVAALGRVSAGDGDLEVVAPEGFAERGPFDVVLELVGGPNLAGDVASLGPGGRIAVIGVGAGAGAELDLLALMARRGRIHGSTLRARPLEQKAEAARQVESHVLPLLATGRVRVPVAETFPLAEAARAHERFSAGAKLGKIVLLSD